MCRIVANIASPVFVQRGYMHYPSSFVSEAFVSRRLGHREQEITRHNFAMTTIMTTV